MLRSLVSLLFFGVVLLANAAEVRVDGNTLVINESKVLNLHAYAGGLSPHQRLRHAVSLLGPVGQVDAVSVTRQKKNFVLSLDGRNLLTVTAQDAVASKTAQERLAYTWAARIRDAVNLPPLKVSDALFVVPTGTVKYVQIYGSQAKSAAVKSDDVNVVKVVKEGTRAKITCTGAGSTAVHISSQDSEVLVEMDVKPFAADLHQVLSAEVTGNPCTSTTIRGAIEGAVRTQLLMHQDSVLTIVPPKPGALGIGKSRTFSARVRIEAPNTFPAVGYVKINVRNEHVRKPREDVLWYSNNPESVKTPGPLFCAPLKVGGAARLLYHHYNDSLQSMFLRVQAINESDKPARVVVIPGESKPDKNPVLAGLVAADQYVRNWIFGSGEVITIPPHSTMPISLRRMMPGDTMSGLCTIGLVEGDKEILVRTDAWPPFTLDPKWQSVLFSSTPWREVGTRPINEFDRAPFSMSQHIYPNPYKLETVDYKVGGRYGFIRIGQKPIVRQDADGSLEGNFGVIYNIKASVENKTSEATDVEIVFEASAGYTGGLFFLNGKYVRTPLLQPKGEARIMRFRMSPGSKQTLDITTLPLSGGSYPATITIRPVLDSLKS